MASRGAWRQSERKMTVQGLRILMRRRRTMATGSGGRWRRRRRRGILLRLLVGGLIGPVVFFLFPQDGLLGVKY